MNQLMGDYNITSITHTDINMIKDYAKRQPNVLTNDYEFLT